MAAIQYFDFHLLSLIVCDKHCNLWLKINNIQSEVDQGIDHLQQMVIQNNLAEKFLLLEGALRGSKQYPGFCRRTNSLFKHIIVHNQS